MNRNIASKSVRKPGIGREGHPPNTDVAKEVARQEVGTRAYKSVSTGHTFAAKGSGRSPQVQSPRARFADPDTSTYEHRMQRNMRAPHNFSNPTYNVPSTVSRPYKAAKKTGPLVAKDVFRGLSTTSPQHVTMAYRKTTMRKKESNSARSDFAYIDPQVRPHHLFTKSSSRSADKASIVDREFNNQRARRTLDDDLWKGAGSRIATRQAGGRNRAGGSDDVVSTPIPQPSRRRVVVTDSVAHGRSLRESVPAKYARKHDEEVQAQVGRKAAKKHNAVNIYESEESYEISESESDAEGSRDSRRLAADLIGKGTSFKTSKTAQGHRTPLTRYKRVQDQALSDDDGLVGDDMFLHSPVPPNTGMRESSPVSASHDIPQRLLRAVESLSLSSGRLGRSGRLPFLRRNLRRAFEARCKQFADSYPMDVEAPAGTDFEVIYRHQLRDSSDLEDDDVHSHDRHDYDEYRASMKEILCPLCDLHGKFSTCTVLKKHLEWDHSEVVVLWGASGERTQIILSIPLLDDVQTSSDSASEMTSSEPEERTTASLQPSLSFDVDRSSISSSQPADVAMLEPPPSHLKLKLRPKYHQSRSPTSSSQAQSISLDNLGPAAKSPYLPYGNIQFSCRPGGPRLYDLLNTLPMEKFGIMSWFIIDKEEEIFEMDDIRDEDKVMMALWSRWILLNRNEFVRDYFRGTKAFVDEYWEMIKLAAGWSALRVWLLMFVVNRFLDGSQVAKILKHYEHLAGMI